MALNRIIFKISFFYLICLLFLACNSTDKKKEEPIKIRESVSEIEPKIFTKSRMGKGSHLDTIVISGMQFLPAELHIKQGDTVVWLNKDIVVHDASEFPGKKWNSGPLQNGSSWKMKVDKSYDYFCSIHITMKGKLVVD